MIATGLLDTGISREDLQSRAEAGEDGVRPDNAFLSEARHPFMNAAGQLPQYVAPLADFIDTGILAGATDYMNGRG